MYTTGSRVCNKIRYPCIFCVDIIFYFCWKGVDIFLQKEFNHFGCFGWSEPLIFPDREIRLITSISEGHGLNLQDWINMQMFYCTLSFLGLNWMQSKGRDEVMMGCFCIGWADKSAPGLNHPNSLLGLNNTTSFMDTLWGVHIIRKADEALLTPLP